MADLSYFGALLMDSAALLGLVALAAAAVIVLFHLTDEDRDL